MPGKTKPEREALERQNAALMAVFERAGFDFIAPDIIQPADIFLERSGENIKASTFVFTDPAGHEMCLRPDLTVPTCRFHLSHKPVSGAEARYCYLGPAFRFPHEDLSPQEFSQAGVEWFAAPQPMQAEARLLKLTLNALEAAGLSRYRVTVGDLGLFFALLDDTAMPRRWRQRLRHHFWRPPAFRSLLEKFRTPPSGQRSSISPFVDQVAEDISSAPALVARLLEEQQLNLVGGRSVDEIAQRLSDKAADRDEKPLAAHDVSKLKAYLETETTLDQAASNIQKFQPGPALKVALDHHEARLAAIEELGLNPRRFSFNATFGRELEYYTGFVFQIEADGPQGSLIVAGGGRYDNLLSDMGSEIPISALGSAIHTERLKAVLS